MAYINGGEVLFSPNVDIHVTEILPTENNLVNYRGKNLGSEITDEQKEAIASGTFNDLYLGDYWTIGKNSLNNDILWRIVDFNYWYGLPRMDTSTGLYKAEKINHIVIMPDCILFKAQMNSSNTTSGGYYGSKMRTESLVEAKTIIADAFGEDMLYEHTEALTNAVSSGGYANAFSNARVTVELPNEIMMYGTQVMVDYFPAETNKTQLALFDFAPKFLIAEGYKGYAAGYWTRDIPNTTQFCALNDIGNTTRTNASTSTGVRPVFGLCYKG